MVKERRWYQGAPCTAPGASKRRTRGILPLYLVRAPVVPLMPYHPDNGTEAPGWPARRHGRRDHGEVPPVKPSATRFLRHLAISVFDRAAIDGFDTTALANVIGREERAIDDIGTQANLSAGQVGAALRELEEVGYVDVIGVLVRLTPAGARWFAGQHGR